MKGTGKKGDVRKNSLSNLESEKCNMRKVVRNTTKTCRFYIAYNPFLSQRLSHKVEETSLPSESFCSVYSMTTYVGPPWVTNSG